MEACLQSLDHAVPSVEVEGNELPCSGALVQDRSVTGLIELAALTSSRSTQAVPASVGPYRVVRLLGEGGMARVFLGECPESGLRVALKQLKPRYATDPQLLRHFYEESQAVRRIQHPNIAAVSEVLFTRDQGAVCVMEHLEGRTLAAVLQGGARLSFQRAMEVGEQVARALSMAHDAGIVHRDVKPSNIYLAEQPDGPGPVKLFDFGIAQLAGVEKGKVNARRLAQLVSPVYMAPEQAREQADGRSDIYSLGVVLFEMLAGRPPFRGRSFAELVYKHAHEAPPRLGSWLTRLRPGQRKLERVILRCLAKDPGARYGSAAELSQDLHALSLS